MGVLSGSAFGTTMISPAETTAMIVPKKIHGRNLPNFVFVRSTITPIPISVTASHKRKIVTKVPANTVPTPTIPVK